MKLKWAAAVCALGMTAQEAPARQWTLTDGRVFEAEYEQILFDDVILKTPEDSNLKVQLQQLSAEDRTYIQLRNPPRLNLEFVKRSRQRRFPEKHPLRFDDEDPEAILYNFTVNIDCTSSSQIPYDLPLTAEFYAIGDQFFSKKRVLLDRQSATFSLSENNDFSFSGREVELLDMIINGYRRGTRYGGYLVVVRDERGEIIAHRESSKNLYEYMENLNRLKVGWYFDDQCNRCLPDPPESWEFANAKYFSKF